MPTCIIGVRRYDLELVVMSRTRSMTEKQLILPERFARTVRKKLSRVTNELAGQPEVCGFQMALHTHLKLPVTT
jgi:hypothetical protein